MSYHFVVFGSIKDVYKTFALYRIWWWRKLSIKMFSKLCHCRIILYLFAGFKIIILCSVHPKWFMKFVFSAKMWFMKTSTRIVNYESQVAKLNPGNPEYLKQNKNHLAIQIHHSMLELLLLVYCSYTVFLYFPSVTNW